MGHRGYDSAGMPSGASAFVAWAFFALILSGFDAPFLSHPDPYEAPPYVPPPPPVSKLKLIDNGDGTLSTPDFNRMWTRADSYADLKRCLNFYEAGDYVKNLRTGGFSDWRLPAVGELAILYDSTQDNVMAWDHDNEFPMSLSNRFADGAAYWYWSNDLSETNLTDCCARTVYFVNGMAHVRRLTACKDGGVRAVRNIR